jgi:hypothetical protein
MLKARTHIAALLGAASGTVPGMTTLAEFHRGG